MPLPLGEVSPKVTERALPLPCGELPPQRLRGLEMAEHKKALSEAASFFVWSPSSLGLKGASSPFLVGPARRNRRALAALNTRHLLRKPVCGLKAPLGLSCLPGTAVLSGSLLSVKREHPLSKPLSPAAPPPPAGPARPAGRRPAAPRSHSIPRRCRAAHAEPARPQRPLPAP